MTADDDILKNFNEDILKSNLFGRGGTMDFRESIGISFKVNCQHLYGIPERADTTRLKSTDGADLYRLYNLDVFEHKPFSKQSLYGSIPYITAHTSKYDVSFLWLNSAETWVNIMKGYDVEREVTWLSEAGKMEFFVFGARLTNGGPK